MAMFGLKEVIDPMAQEVRDGYENLLARLNVIGDSLQHLVEIARDQRAASEETNRLLAVLAQQGAPKPASRSGKPASTVKS